MNVLLIGGAGGLMTQLMNKLKKEGHRIFVLTGSRFPKEGYEKAFEKYNFTYDTDCMNEIFESVNPDVIICLGAHDTNFSWVGEQRDAVRFVSSITNILAAYAVGKFGRFIFLSSVDVFEGDYPEDIGEDEPTQASSLRAMAIAQAEELCMNYQKSKNLDLVVLRMDHMYVIPEDIDDVNETCSMMCLSAIKDKTIKANVNRRFAMIYQTDAVEYIYRMMICIEHAHSIYHISSSEEISELELATYIQEDSSGTVQIEEQTDWNARVVLSNKRYHEEFGIKIFNHAPDVAKKMIRHMRQEKRKFLIDKENDISLWENFKRKLGWFVTLLLPFLENMVCFIPFFMLNNRAVGSRYFERLDFYLLYVVLFAIVHGQQQAVFSAVLATGGYLFRQMYDRTSFDVIIDYNTYIWVVQLFMLGMTIGYIRDQIRMLRESSREERQFLNLRLSDMTDINQSNVRVKGALETEIINHNDSIGKIYNITSQLDRYMPEEVLFYAAEMVSKLTNSKDVAIYTVSNGDFARLASATSSLARQYGHSIRYHEMEEMSRAIEEKRVYINKTIDQRFPNMATAIYEGDSVQLILMVWGIPWEQMTLGQANLLKVVSYLIQNAVLHASRYMAALEDKRYIDGNKVMETDSFTTLVQAFLHAMDRELTECTILHVCVEKEEYRKAGELLNRKLRQSDYLGTLRDEKMYALLANTSKKDANIVIRRFKECGYEAEVVEDIRV